VDIDGVSVMQLQNKVAVVTGAASGLGAAIAARFAREGARVIAADIAAGSPYALDVADSGSCAALVRRVMQEKGRIDYLVNSAGIGADVPFLDTTPELFDRIIAVNLRGTFLIGQACARVMGAGGAIVNIASVSGMRGNTGRTAYGASKGGVITMTQVMAAELASRGIRVNAISPGPVDTPLVEKMHDAEIRAIYARAIPMQRYGKPEEIACAALFLCSNDASYITGHVLVVDGGFMGGGIRR
jgi:NAD(P)-dependent dehydrogenase (short-subunit alcohol dehydrogenase family)